MEQTYRIELGGQWQLTGRQECGLPPKPFADGDVHTMTDIPANIEDALFHGGYIADPYVSLNALQLRPYEFYEWTFTREFEYDGAQRSLELVFEGLDCIAAIWLNGQEIGTSQNALISHSFPVSSALKKGLNRLEIHIASANNAFRHAPLYANSYCHSAFTYEMTRIRKPAHSWGWDIAPRMALGGIFRPVFIRELPPYRIEEDFLQLQNIMEDGSALMFYRYKLEIPEFAISNLKITVDGVCGDSCWHAECAAWAALGAFYFTVKQPRLWWPRHHGTPNLYAVTARLIRPSTGAVLAEHAFTAGIRKIQLHFNPTWTSSPEPDVQFIVNDTPVRVFGTNHVPADALHSHDPERLQKIVDYACELDCNMMRIWGGGIYESNEFYDRCDREGILLWHDFMMGCAIYPNDKDFQDVLRSEAESVVRRLRQHPCIALWAGDNECDAASSWGLRQNPEDNILTRRILPDVCRLFDSERQFLPSSPCHTPEAAQAAKAAGSTDEMSLAPEQHLWGPRDYFKSDFYRNTHASFVSEIGYHGCPNVFSIRRFITPGKEWPWQDNEEWNYHASNPFLRDDTGLNYRTRLMARQTKEMFGFIPENLEDFALASQICQAEAKKYFVELARSRKKMTGLLWWNLIDCWPQFSDAIMDYYYGKKLAFHYLKRIQHPFVIIMPEAASWQQRIVAANDSRETVSGSYTVEDAETHQLFSSGDFTLAPGTIADLDSRDVCTTEHRLLLIRWKLSDGTVGANHALTGHPQFNFAWYRKLLPLIADLDSSFVADAVAR